MPAYMMFVHGEQRLISCHAGYPAVPHLPPKLPVAHSFEEGRASPCASLIPAVVLAPLQGCTWGTHRHHACSVMLGPATAARTHTCGPPRPAITCRPWCRSCSPLPTCLPSCQLHPPLDCPSGEMPRFACPLLHHSHSAAPAACRSWTFRAACLAYQLRFHHQSHSSVSACAQKCLMVGMPCSTRAQPQAMLVARHTEALQGASSALMQGCLQC